MENVVREKIKINGIVQGVGFRPFVFSLAQQEQMAGYVFNGSEGVLIEAEGDRDHVSRFVARLKSEAPPLSQIVLFQTEHMEPLGDESFVIKKSRRAEKSVPFISPDVGTCADCLAELFDPNDRRFRYPFINCTNCGPRYTIVRATPYDRPLTSMGVFPLCAACDREYRDPLDRRFHAQPNACPACGPHVTLVDRDGQAMTVDDPLNEAVRALGEGKIMAIRGLGGFHLAVDARNEEAVAELRRRKGRVGKPFALMAPDLDAIRRFCTVTEEDETALTHHRRPIVILSARPGAQLAPSVAPGQNTFGFMLAYTPLHHLLLRHHFDALVMTSGNKSEEPIAIGNREALTRLAPLADLFLLHNREILQRCDDSIVRVAVGQARVIRRARGFVPNPIFLAKPTRKKILACGGELKNTVALSRGDTVFLGQHIGDLDNPTALDFFEHVVGHLKSILEIEPEVLGYDLHPDYLSTQWALAQRDIPTIGVQHHHAHLAAVQAEHGVDEACVGIILDGTGFGLDETIWGGEVLVGDARDFVRHAHLETFPLPGGTAAIRSPWRIAQALLAQAFGDDFVDLDPKRFSHLQLDHRDDILRLIETRLNTPLTSSCGRLFDAVSAILGVCTEVDYEAQAAIALEMAMGGSPESLYDGVVEGVQTSGPIGLAELIRAIAHDFQADTAVATIAARFHATLAEMFFRAAQSAAQQYHLCRVALSGGVFQNVPFFSMLYDRLTRAGFDVLTHTQVPTNDGGLALGQIAVVNARLTEL